MLRKIFQEESSARRCTGAGGIFTKDGTFSKDFYGRRYLALENISTENFPMRRDAIFHER